MASLDFNKQIGRVYTGKMLVPYFGTENPQGELRTSASFFDMGLKLKYKVKLNGAFMEFSGGIKNILNSYQNDFDIGINRDPAYVYGPLAPRTIYVGIRFGNMLSQGTGVSIASKQGRGLRRGQSSRPDRQRKYRNRK